MYGGLNGLLSQANSAVAKAHRDKLDPGQVPALTATLRTEVSTHVDATSTIRALVAAVQSLHALLGLNHNVAAGLPPLLYSVDQAAAERTPNAPASWRSTTPCPGVSHGARNIAAQLRRCADRGAAGRGRPRSAPISAATPCRRAR